MEQLCKIPIVVGVTGHRNICPEDRDILKQNVSEALTEIQSLCSDGTPVIMLCGMAQGADILCAEAAFEKHIPVYAVLPFGIERFTETFDDESERGKLRGYLDKCAKIIYVSDVERQKEFIQSRVGNFDDDSYSYRQVGVYMAKHSHLMIALWDGKGPAAASKYGCGTVETVEFALEHNYLNKDSLFKSGMIDDSAVIWVKTNRVKQGKHISDNDGNEWLIAKCTDTQTDDNAPYYQKFQSTAGAPDFLKQAIKETDIYNNCEQQTYDDVHLWNNLDELNGYHKNLRSHYIKANGLSFLKNQPKYKRSMLALAILGALIAMFFMVYDDAGLVWMIIPCTVAVILIITLSERGRRKAYHANYIKYRAFAEALRIQFYLSLSLNETDAFTNVCDLYSWSQKVNFMWIRKAIRAIGVVSDNSPVSRGEDFLDRVKEAWVGNGDKPEGQLSYHTRKKSVNKKLRDKYEKITAVLTWSTVALYALICLFEVITFICGLSGKTFFWSESSPLGLPYRSIGTIIVGTLAAASLLFSSYWGKRSFDRLYDDNDKMSKLYRSAYSRWTEVTAGGEHSDKEFENFVKEIAREEIVENGIWCSYIEENTLDINL